MTIAMELCCEQVLLIYMHVRYWFSGVCVSVRVFFGALNMSEGCLFVLYRRGRAKLTPWPRIVSLPHPYSGAAAVFQDAKPGCSRAGLIFSSLSR